MTFVENISSSVAWSLYHDICARGGGTTRMARGGIRLVHGLTKSTYYSVMKKDPKYPVLHAFFSICLSCSFQNFFYMTKNTPFFPILHVFAPLNDVRAYSAWSWKTTLITWIFGRAWYPPWHSSDPRPFVIIFPIHAYETIWKPRLLCQKNYYKIRVKATICVSRMKLRTLVKFQQFVRTIKYRFIVHQIWCLQ